MSADRILDHILIPRPNGSEGLERVATFIAETLQKNGAAVTWHEFTATHFGDHFSWGTWGFRQGPATGVAIALAEVAGEARRRGLLAPNLLEDPFNARGPDVEDHRNRTCVSEAVYQGGTETTPAPRNHGNGALELHRLPPVRRPPWSARESMARWGEILPVVGHVMMPRRYGDAV